MADYILDEQVGFILRQVSQRHAVIFASHLGVDLTPTQWAVLAKLQETGPTSQNLLGRLTAMDAATIKGVVDRLIQRDLIGTSPDPEDARRRLVALTPLGDDLVQQHVAAAKKITEETLAPLKPSEREVLIGLLNRLK